MNSSAAARSTPNSASARAVILSPVRLPLLAPAYRIELVLVAVVTIAIIAYAYWVTPDRPGAIGALGFFGWADQRDYLSEVNDLAGGHLPSSAQDYSYGLGYPAIGVPFKWLGMTDPFIIPDLIMLAIAQASTYVLALRLAGRRSAIAVVSLLILATPLVQLGTVPWTSTVSYFAIAVALLIATAPSPITRVRAAALGVLIGAVFAARYVDAALIGVIATWCVVALGWSRRVTLALFAAVPAAIIGLLVLFSHYIVFGSPFTTPYATHYRDNGTSDQSLSHYSLIVIPKHFVETFLSGQSDGVRTGGVPLLVLSPFLILVPIGAYLVLKKGNRLRSLHVVTLATSTILSLVYLSFVAGGGQDLLYRNYRYWISFYPYWTLLAVIVVAAVVSRFEGRIRIVGSNEPERASLSSN